MKRIVLILIITFFVWIKFEDFYFVPVIAISGFFFIQLIIDSTNKFAFREWCIFLYCLNYLIAPAITYQFDQSTLFYPMKIPASEYFAVSIPGVMCFIWGMYASKTTIFTPNVVKLDRDSRNNELLLRKFVILGVALQIAKPLFPVGIAFFIYLFSSIRYVGVFGLFSMNSGKYWKWICAVFLVEFYFAIKAALFHDAMMWVLFFALFYVFIKKPKFIFRLVGLFVLIFIVLSIQSVKSIYRSKVWQQSEESSIGLFAATTLESQSDVGGENNLLSSLNRSNQAWIFASTKSRMDRTGDFQGLHILGIYFEAAVLPRFLFPNKIKSGDKEIFNTFSGHVINNSTSMGLGVFADGYIAYGFFGVLIFTFGLGILFNITFKFIESWSKLSTFYVLLVLPILNYAIRPDCELQTTINHITKGIFVFGILVMFTKFNFVVELNKELIKRSKKFA